MKDAPDSRGHLPRPPAGRQPPAPAVTTPAALVRAVETELRAAGVSLGRQVRALEELHGLFTSERSRVKRLSYLDIPRLRNAYLRYHLPLNVARATCLLRHLLEIQPGIAELSSVADLGAGLGSASLATLTTLPAEPGREYLLQDRSRAALRVGSRLLEEAAAERSPAESPAPGTRIHSRTGRLPSLPPLPRRCLLWLSMVLNEIDFRSRRGPAPAPFLAQLAGALEPPSVVIVLEPALRAPGRDLLRLHDLAVSSGDWRVLAPCTHQLSCPLLELRDRSWCHFRFRWEAPHLVREVADPLGLDSEWPSFAYLALQRVGRGARELSPASPHPGRARVIGDRMALRDRKRGLYICREGKRETAVEPRPPLRRGDVVEEGPGGGWRVVAPWL